MEPDRPDLTSIVTARRIAVIGASEEPQRIGGRPIDFLRRCGFSGGVYPVNPKRTTVQGLRCYPAVADLPEPIDVAIVAVPAREVATAVRECAGKGARAAIVYSSGFGEVGREGQTLQAELIQLARRVGVRVVGPNCQGLAAVHQRLNLSFSSALIDLGEPGPVALIAQSGAVGGMLFALLRERGARFSYWISSGNEADITLAECLEFLAADDHTRVIGAYVEGIREGPRLLSAIAEARRAGKPVVLLRAGRSAQAARAAQSHTGAMAVEDQVARTLLRHAGATDAADVFELVDCVDLLSRETRAAGDRIGLLSNSGGLGVLIADACADLGLALRPLSDATQRQLRDILPVFGAAGNPVDITAQMLGDSTLLSRSLDALLQAPDIDVLVVALTMVTRLYPVERIVGDIVRAGQGSSKPLLACWVASDASGLDQLRQTGQIPTFADPTRCVRALALVRQADGVPRRSGSTPSARPAPADAGRQSARRSLAGHDRSTLDEAASKVALRAYGVPTVTERLADSPAAAVEASRAIGFPVALKVCAPEIGHKSDLGLLCLDLQDADAVRQACTDLEAALRRAFPNQPRYRWLVQRMVPAGGIEVVLGVKRDPVFGPVVMAGLGGVFVEYFNDVAFALAPVDRDAALALLGSLRAHPLFRGARGRSPVDEGAVADALVSLSEFAVDLQDLVVEVDINPLIALPRGQGAVAVDALVVLDQVGSKRAC